MFVPYNLDVLNLVQVGEGILQNLVLPLEMRAQIIIVVRLVVAQVADVVLLGFMPTENVFLQVRLPGGSGRDSSRTKI